MFDRDENAAKGGGVKWNGFRDDEDGSGKSLLHIEFSGSMGDVDDGKKTEFHLEGWRVNVVVLLVLLCAYWLLTVAVSHFSTWAVPLVAILGLFMVRDIFSGLVSLVERFRTHRRDALSAPGKRGGRAEGLITTSCSLLPSDVRERHLDEWLDDLQCRRDRGSRVWPAAVWIVFRCVMPLTLRSIGATAIRRITRR